MADPTRIILIDDHSLFREAIARLLDGQPDFAIAGQCATVDEGIRIIKESRVDVVLLDINLGMQQGGAFPNLAHAEGFTGKILVVTAGVSKLEAARLLQRGCAGIFLKHEPPQKLIDSIRSLVRGEDVGDLASADATIKQLESSGQSAPAPLTRREYQVLRGVFGGRTNKEIAFELKVSEPLVKSVLQQLFTKTNVRTRAQLVRVAVEQYWKELESETGD